jgi:hypothetical protein
MTIQLYSIAFFADIDPYSLSRTLNLLLLSVSVVVITTLCLAIFYLKKGYSWTFVVSSFLTLVLIGMATFLAAGDESIPNKIENWMFIPSLIISGILFYKKVKQNPTQVFWYYGLNTSLLLLLSNFIQLLDITAFNFLFYLNYAFYALICFFYVKRSLKIDNLIGNKTLFVNTNLICILSFLTVMIFFLITTTQREIIMETFILNLKYYIKSLAIILAIGNISTLIAIKKYS